jgi:CRISPR/Cas system-associated exonuclease Cas4 (RecB family)
MQANPHDDQALFHVFTSNIFGVTHTEMQQVLHLHRLRDSPQPIWTFISDLVPAVLPSAHDHRENASFAAEPLVFFEDSASMGNHAASTVAGPLFLASSALTHAVQTLQQTQRKYQATCKVGVALRSLIKITGLEKQLNAPTSLQDEMRATAVASVLRMVADAESGQVSPALLSLKQSTQTIFSHSAMHQPILGAQFVLGVLSDFIIEQGLPLRHEVHHHSTPVTEADDVSAFNIYEGTGIESHDEPTLLTVADVVDGPVVAAITDRVFHARLDNSSQDSIIPLHRDSEVTHVVVTTERRALQHRYDCVVIPWASDSTMPGSMTSQEFAFVHKSFPTWKEGSATTRESHIAQKKWTLMQLLQQSTHGAIFVTPPPASTATSTSNKRSRFLDAIFGIPPTASCDVIVSTPTSAPCNLDQASITLLLSYTRLHEYMWCPHRFYLRRIINLEPPGTPAMLYGRALHAAVAQCTQLLQEFIFAQLDVRAFDGLSPVKRLEALTAAVTVPSLPASRSRMQAGIGSLPSKSHLVVAMQREFDACWKGRQVNSSTREDTIDDIGRYDLVHVPVAQAADLEKEARLAIDRYADAELISLRQQLHGDGSITLPLLVETPFASVLGSTNSLVRGVIDRVDATFDSAGLVSFSIIEYKSSLQWKQAAALENRRRDKLQTSLYQLALPILLDLPSALPVLAQIRSIETNDILEMTASPSVLKTTAVKVDEISRRIRQNAFPAIPSHSRCGMCSFVRSCSHAHGALRSTSEAKVRAQAPT